MNFPFNINFTGSANSISKTNLIEKYKNSTYFQTENEQDTITLNKDFITNLKYCKDKSDVGSVIEGTVNNKPTMLKSAFKKDELWFEGAIDNKYILFHEKGNSYDGKYGNSEYNLTINCHKPSNLSKFYYQIIKGQIFIPDYFNVKGNIGDKEIDITLPDIKIPEDEETKDILTMILVANGLKAQTINGEIKSLGLSSSELKKVKSKYQNRQKVINNDIKPIFMQGISSATGLVVGSIVSAMLLKFGVKHGH